MVTYQIVKEQLQGEDSKEYVSYGIRASRMENNVPEPVAFISDVFLSEERANHFVTLLNRLELDLIHFPEVVADAVANAM